MPQVLVGVFREQASYEAGDVVGIVTSFIAGPRIQAVALQEPNRSHRQAVPEDMCIAFKAS